MSKIVEGLKYSESHEWVKVEDGVAFIGVSDFAQKEMGDITYVDMPDVDDEVTAGEEFGALESVKAASDLISPVMAGLGMFCKYDKDFIGKEALLAQKGGEIVRKLVGIEIEDKAIPRAGYPVELEDGTEVGVVTTGYHSISLDKSICFALVDKAYAALDTPLWIRIRKKVFPGKVVKKRFYQTNYKK